MQGGASGTENCDWRGLMYSAWPIRVGWVAGSGWMPIWLTNADQLRSVHAEPGSQSNQPQSARVSCGSSVKSVFWIWSLRPGCSKVSWDLWNGTISPSNSLPSGEGRGVLFLTPTPLGELIGAISLLFRPMTLSRRSYQPIVLASLWSRLWSPAAN